MKTKDLLVVWIVFIVVLLLSIWGFGGKAFGETTVSFCNDLTVNVECQPEPKAPKKLYMVILQYDSVAGHIHYARLHSEVASIAAWAGNWMDSYGIMNKVIFELTPIYKDTTRKNEDGEFLVIVHWAERHIIKSAEIRKVMEWFIVERDWQKNGIVRPAFFKAKKINVRTRTKDVTYFTDSDDSYLNLGEEK